MTQPLSTLQQLQVAVDQAVAENAKFESGNNAAGTRARRALAEVMKLAKQRRQEISDAKNAAAAADAK